MTWVGWFMLIRANHLSEVKHVMFIRVLPVPSYSNYEILFMCWIWDALFILFFCVPEWNVNKCLYRYCTLFTFKLPYLNLDLFMRTNEDPGVFFNLCKEQNIDQLQSNNWKPGAMTWVQIPWWGLHIVRLRASNYAEMHLKRGKRGFLWQQACATEQMLNSTSPMSCWSLLVLCNMGVVIALWGWRKLLCGCSPPSLVALPKSCHDSVVRISIFDVFAWSL